MELVVIAMIVNIRAHWYIAVQKFSKYVKVNNNNTPQIYSLLPCNLLLIIFTISIFVECSFLERMRRHHTHKHKTHHKIKLSHKSSS